MLRGYSDPDGGWMTGDGSVWASCSGMEITCIGPGKVRAEVMNSNGERSMERIGIERAGSSIRGTSERSEKVTRRKQQKRHSWISHSRS